MYNLNVDLNLYVDVNAYNSRIISELFYRVYRYITPLFNTTIIF